MLENVDFGLGLGFRKYRSKTTTLERHESAVESKFSESGSHCHDVQPPLTRRLMANR